MSHRQSMMEEMSTSDGIDLFYPVNSQLPSPRANSIQIMNTCHCLAQNGVNVHVLARERGSGSLEDTHAYYGLSPHPMLHIHLLPTARLGSDMLFNATFQASMIRRLWQLRDLERRQIVFTRDILCASSVLRLSPLLGLPVVCEVHALNHMTNPMFTNTQPNDIRQGRLKRREEYVYTRSKALVAISNSCRKALLGSFASLPPIEVVPDGTPLYIQPTVKPDTPPTRLLYVGQFYPWKGVDTAVRAMAHLPGWTLDLYGGEYFTAVDDIARLESVAAEIGAASSIRFRGFLAPGRIGEVLRESYIGILPAADNIMGRHFISPLKLFEYMGTSVPLVASDLPPIREIIAHERNGLLYKAGDAAALAAQVRRLAEDHELRRRITAQAYQDAQGYSYDNRAKLITRLLPLRQKLLNEQNESS